jgi:hypothetical protein
LPSFRKQLFCPLRLPTGVHPSSDEGWRTHLLFTLLKSSSTSIRNHVSCGVCPLSLCQFVANVALRPCSLRARTFLLEMQSPIEYGQMLRGSACPHLRARFIHLKDSSKQANEVPFEPHRTSLLAISKGCVRDHPDQITVVASLAPHPIDEGMCSGLARDDRSREGPKLILWGKKSMTLLLVVILYQIREYKSSMR